MWKTRVALANGWENWPKKVPKEAESFLRLGAPLEYKSTIFDTWESVSWVKSFSERYSQQYATVYRLNHLSWEVLSTAYYDFL